MDWRSVRFDWNQARAFLVTAQEGSFSAAGRALSLTQPTVGRQVAALEEELGITLFERVGTRLELTAVGADLVEHVRVMSDAATRVSLTAAGQAESVSGTVAITCSEAIAAYLLPPILGQLRQDHPGIEIELVVSNQARDLRRREADIAIRNFRTEQPDLIARKVKDSTAGFYASPAYLEWIGPICVPEDLSRAELFAFDRTEVMIQGLRELGVELTHRQFPIVTDNHLVQWQLCQHGVGVCIMMEEIGAAEPRVQRILPELALPIPTWVVSHRELRTSRRIRLVFDRIFAALGGDAGGE